jgi:hypothetical protein
MSTELDEKGVKVEKLGEIYKHYIPADQKVKTEEFLT